MDINATTAIPFLSDAQAIRRQYVRVVKPSLLQGSSLSIRNRGVNLNLDVLSHVDVTPRHNLRFVLFVMIVELYTSVISLRFVRFIIILKGVVTSRTQTSVFLI